MAVSSRVTTGGVIAGIGGSILAMAGHLGVVGLGIAGVGIATMVGSSVYRMRKSNDRTGLYVEGAPLQSEIESLSSERESLGIDVTAAQGTRDAAEAAIASDRQNLDVLKMARSLSQPATAPVSTNEVGKVEVQDDGIRIGRILIPKRQSAT